MAESGHGDAYGGSGYPQSATGTAQHKKFQKDHPQKLPTRDAAIIVHGEDGALTNIGAHKPLATAHVKWLDKAQITKPQGGGQAPGGEPQRIKLRTSDNQAAPETEYERKKKQTHENYLIAQKDAAEAAADDQRRADAQRKQTLSGGKGKITLADLKNGSPRIDEFFKVLEDGVKEHPNAPEVIQAKKRVGELFTAIYAAFVAAKDSAGTMVLELTKNSGWMHRPDEKLIATINREMQTLTDHRNASKMALDQAKYRQAQASLMLAYIECQAMAGTADLLASSEVSSAEAMIAHIRTVQVACEAMLTVMSAGLDGLLAKAAFATVGAMGLGAEKISSEKLFDTPSDITPKQIGYKLFLDLLFVGVGKGIDTLGFEAKLAPALGKSLPEAGPEVKAFLQKQGLDVFAAGFKAFLDTNGQRYFAKYADTSMTPKQLAFKILEDASNDYARGGLGTALATAFKNGFIHR